jgi:hypothetical protein
MARSLQLESRSLLLDGCLSDKRHKRPIEYGQSRLQGVEEGKDMGRNLTWLGALALGASVLGGCPLKRVARATRDAADPRRARGETRHTGNMFTIEDGDTKIRIVDTDAAITATYECPGKAPWGLDMPEDTGPVYTAEEWTAAGGRLHLVTAQDVGVPFYPGAWAVYAIRDKQGGTLTLQLQTTDPYEKVAEFYKQYYNAPTSFRHDMHLGPFRTSTVEYTDEDNCTGLMSLMQDPAGKGTSISFIRSARD